MTEEQIKIEINGIEYLKFEPVVTTKWLADHVARTIRKYDGIIRKFDVQQSFWVGTKVSIECLIPVKHAIAFSNEKI